jgi:CheY-like chemotaxis protein
MGVAADFASEPSPEPATPEDAVPFLGSHFFEEPAVVIEPEPAIAGPTPAPAAPAPMPEPALHDGAPFVIEHTSLAERTVVFEAKAAAEDQAAIDAGQAEAPDAGLVFAGPPAPEPGQVTDVAPAEDIAPAPASVTADAPRLPGPEEPRAAAAIASADAGQRPLRALVVDDDADIRMIVTATLRKMAVPVDVVQARDGVEAIEKAREAPPDLAILDVMMPRMDGFETCRALRADVRTAFVPILMLTASADQDSRTKGYLIGTDDYMAKPFLPVDLKLRIARLLRRTYGI